MKCFNKLHCRPDQVHEDVVTIDFYAKTACIKHWVARNVNELIKTQVVHPKWLRYSILDDFFPPLSHPFTLLQDSVRAKSRFRPWGVITYVLKQDSNPFASDCFRSKVKFCPPWRVIASVLKQDFVFLSEWFCLFFKKIFRPPLRVMASILMQVLSSLTHICVHPKVRFGPLWHVIAPILKQDSFLSDA